MHRYVARRLLLFVPTLVGASLFVFFIMRVLPGDVAVAILGQGDQTIRQEALDQLRRDLGLYDPLYVQYGRWVRSIASPEMGGVSIVTGETIGKMLARRFPVTLQLTLLTVAITVLLGPALGLLSALTQDRWPDYLIRSVTILGLAMPHFWLALLAILAMVLWFSWAPPVIYRPFWQSPMTNFQMMIWPALVLSWGFSSYLVRVTRAQVLEVLRQDYVRTARSKGLQGKTVLTRHVLRNALIPVVTLGALHLDSLLAGSLILENIFSLPGVGQGIVQGASQRDYPVIQGLAMVLVLVTLAINLIVDILYAFIDPRIKYS